MILNVPKNPKAGLLNAYYTPSLDLADEYFVLKHYFGFKVKMNLSI